MSRNPQIAIVTIVGVHLGFEDTQAALELMAILSKAVQLENYLYSVRDYTEAEYCLADGDSLPSMKFIHARLVDGEQTIKQIKERGEREKKDREDMEQQMNPTPEPLALPAPPPDVPF